MSRVIEPLKDSIVSLKENPVGIIEAEGIWRWTIMRS